MVSKSVEIRWWATEKAEMWDWFEANVLKTRSPDPDERTDYYLNSFDDRISVKWRVGNLEFKFRTSILKLPMGLKEEYLKESLPSELKQNDLPFDAMIPVSKKRYKRMFRPSIGLMTDSKTLIDEGCQIEFTEVRVADQNPVYSIGFEAFSNEVAALAILNEVLDLFPMEEDFFSVENSEGYASKIKRAHLKK